MPSTKQCSKCNSPFECKADGSGCWCEAYHIPPAILNELKTTFDNCLCPPCLAAYAEKGGLQQVVT